MTDIDTTLLEETGAAEEKQAKLWPVAVVILLVVFVPALIAWGLSMVAYH